MKKLLISTLLGASLFAQTAQAEQPLMVNIKRLSLESAMTIAKATIDACREKGIQVGVTVVDRGGHPQAVLRDVLAPDLTLAISKEKAYTALSFSVPTSQLAERSNTPIGAVDGITMSAGGLPITAAGEMVGAVGVSGAPSGKTDEACAQAGIDAIAADLEMSAF